MWKINLAQYYGHNLVSTALKLVLSGRCYTKYKVIIKKNTFNH